MRIMVGIGHPKQVHFWKNIMINLINAGHDVKIVAWDKDKTLYLLNVYGFKYEIIGKNYRGLIKKAYGMFVNELKLLKVAHKFKPDIFLAGAPYLAHVSRLVGKPHIDFTDTENAHLANMLSSPFTDIIITPSCYKGKFESKKHIKFNGYMELAYLHSNYFKPDPSMLDELGLDKNGKFILVRFVAWDASHDIGDKGFINKNKVIDTLKQYGKLFISSELKLPEEYQKYKIDILPEKIHSLMYYADLFIGESASMACESAILGTPSIFVSTSRRGYTDELDESYEMLFNFSDPKNGQENALKKAIELLDDKGTKKRWQEKRTNLLKEKIDVTKFITDLIENYPDCLYKLKNNN